MSLGPTFHAMVVTLGSERLAGLPPVSAAQTMPCRACHASTDHTVGFTVVNGTYVEVYVCQRCGQVSSFAPDPDAP